MSLFSNNSIWVKWPFYVKTLGAAGLGVAILIIGETREDLLKNHMFDVQRRYAEDVNCDNRSLTARTEDGTCNSLETPAMGAANIRFGRNVPIEQTYGESGDRLITPNPRDISLKLMSRENFIPARSLNFIAAAWIQFMTHDWFSHGQNQESNPILVPLAKDDPFAKDFLEVRRTRLNTETFPEDEGQPATYTNNNTHWWDGSQIYGSDAASNEKVRAFKDGKLLVSEEGRLPRDFTGMPVTGFSDNWWLGLSMLHQLFVLEHNSVAEMIKSKHPAWNDQQIYDKARLVISALMAKIHTVEWTPAILANPALEFGMNANWFGALGAKQQGVVRDGLRIVTSPLAQLEGLVGSMARSDSKFAAFLDGNHAVERALGGLVGSPKASYYGVPYTLTEEFVSVYRMHPLLRDNIDIFSIDNSVQIGSIPLENTRNSDAETIMAKQNIDDLWYSFGTTHPGALTLGNYPKFLQNLSLPVGNIDLATVDVLRDRERGVPRYNQFRRLIGLKPIESFEDLETDAATLRKLKMIYNDKIEDLDLLVGSLAENVRPEGFGFGETSFQIFILNASRRLMTDRFLTEDFTPAVYTTEGLNWVQTTTMNDILVRHFPRLAAKIGAQSNAFKPWPDTALSNHKD